MARLSFLLVLLNLLFYKEGYSQESPYYKAYLDLKSKGYNTAIQNLNDYWEENKEKESFNSASFFQAFSTFYSFVGNDSLALKYFDQAFSDELSNNSTIDPSIDLTAFKVQKAVDYIVSKSKNKRVVIINEAHHVPQHRILSQAIAERLKGNGFRYFAFEGLSYNDSNISMRGYPEIITSGFYASEPNFGNMIRSALENNYTLIPYDVAPSCDQQPNKDQYCNNLRDLYQAKEIVKILMEDSTARILVHCGFDHNQEKTNTNWIKMAEYIKVLSGIDPFSINQTKYNQHGFDSRESQFYFTISKEIKENEAFILLDNEGNSYFPEKYNGYFDVQVYWPRLTYVHGRPAYLFAKEGVKKVSLKKKFIERNRLIQAFVLGETGNSVPVDQFIVGDEIIDYCLVLPKGKFSIRVKDEADVILNEYEIEVE